jgi:hypothetical protein
MRLRVPWIVLLGCTLHFLHLASSSSLWVPSSLLPVAVAAEPLPVPHLQLPTVKALWFAWQPCNNLAALGALYPVPIHFNMTCVPLSEWHEAAFDDFRSSHQYDIVVLDSQFIGEAVEDGFIVNLNSFVAQSESRFGDFWPNAIDSYSEYPVGSKQYWGFPFQGQGQDKHACGLESTTKAIVLCCFLGTRFDPDCGPLWMCGCASCLSGDVQMLVYRKDLFALYNKNPPLDLREMLQLGQFFSALHLAATPYGFTSFWCGDTSSVGQWSGCNHTNCSSSPL